MSFFSHLRFYLCVFITNLATNNTTVGDTGKSLIASAIAALEMEG